MRNFQNQQEVEDAIRKSFEAFANVWNQWDMSLNKRAVSKNDRYREILANAQTDAFLASTSVDVLGLKEGNFLEGISEQTQTYLLSRQKDGKTTQAAYEEVGQRWKNFTLDAQIENAKNIIKRMKSALFYMGQLAGAGHCMPSRGKAKVNDLVIIFNEIAQSEFGIGGKKY